MIEFGQCSGLDYKPIQSPGILLPIRLGERMYGIVSVTDGHFHGQIFLDGDIPVQIQVTSVVGNPESTLTQDFYYAIPV